MKQDLRDDAEPLLGPALPTSQHEEEEHDTKLRWRDWLSKLHAFAHFETTHPRFRYLPLVGCLMVLANEIEYWIKYVSCSANELGL